MIVYSSFDCRPEEVHKRPEKDYGLVLQSGTGDELPSLIIQSCWSKKYKRMFREMQRWMKWGAGMVQVVVLLKWSLVCVKEKDPILEVEIGVYEYAPKTSSSYKQILHEVRIISLQASWNSLYCTIANRGIDALYYNRQSIQTSMSSARTCLRSLSLQSSSLGHRCNGPVGEGHPTRCL